MAYGLFLIATQLASSEPTQGIKNCGHEPRPCTYCCIINKNQILEAVQVPVNARMNKENGMDIHSEVLSHHSEQNHIIRKMGRTGDCHVK